jgi:hypothetical protein
MKIFQTLIFYTSTSQEQNQQQDTRIFLKKENIFGYL